MTTGHYRHGWDVFSVSISVLVEGVIGVTTHRCNNRTIDPLDSYNGFTSGFTSPFSPTCVKSMHTPVSVHVCLYAWAVFLHVHPRCSQEETAAGGTVPDIPEKHCLSLLVVVGSPVSMLVDPCVIPHLPMEQTPSPCSELDFAPSITLAIQAGCCDGVCRCLNIKGIGSVLGFQPAGCSSRF